MRARGGLLLGWAVVAAWVALLGAVSVDAVREPDLVRPEASDTALDPIAGFIAAWERSRTSTFLAMGTYERHSVVTGASVASEDVVAQRPPRRLHRQLGGIAGRDDDRTIVCPAPPPEQADDPAPCRLGPPGGDTYAESVAREVAGLRSILDGPAPLYTVVVGDPGCFRLEQVRIDPRAPFGTEASFCFDEATGAPSGSRVVHEGGVVEVVVVTEITTEVTDADLEP